MWTLIAVVVAIVLTTIVFVRHYRLSPYYILTNQLYKIAEALNIEDGFLATRAKIWANVTLVYDQPLQTHTDIYTYLNQKQQPLLGLRVPNFNVPQMFYNVLTIILYYFNKYPNKQFRLIFHQPEAFTQIDIFIKKHLSNFSTPKYTIQLDKIDYYDTTYYFNQDDILLTFSLCAGLSPHLKPGDLIAADHFIPYIDNTIYKSQEYTVRNDILLEKTQIETYQIPKLKDYIESYYQTLITPYLNIQHLTMLQVNKLWSPVTKYVKVI